MPRAPRWRRRSRTHWLGSRLRFHTLWELAPRNLFGEVSAKAPKQAQITLMMSVADAQYSFPQQIDIQQSNI